MDWAKTTATADKKRLNFGIWCDLYWSFNGNFVVSTKPADHMLMA